MKLLLVPIVLALLISCKTTESSFVQPEPGALKDAVPMVIIEPRYPRVAAIEGVEGYVVFSFDLSETGTVEKLKIIESVPAGIFDQVATTAIEKWKFKPAKRNGDNVRQEGMRYTLEFKMGD